MIILYSSLDNNFYTDYKRCGRIYIIEWIWNEGYFVNVTLQELPPNLDFQSLYT